MKKEPLLTIRAYKKNDWPLVKQWWALSKEVAPLETMMPTESSFVAEIDGNPALAVTVYLTNTPEVTYVENFIGNPEYRGETRKKLTEMLLACLGDFVSRLGYRRLLCMSEKPELKNYYKEIGFTKTLDGVATFTKEVVCHQ